MPYDLTELLKNGKYKAMGYDYKTVKFPKSAHQALEAAKDIYNAGQKRGSKISLANFLVLKFNELQIAQLSQPSPSPAPVEEKPVVKAEIKPEVEVLEENAMDCPNCAAREIEIKRLQEEVISGLKTTATTATAAQKREEELTAGISELKRRLEEKPAPVAADTIPDDLSAMIEHCESGQCAAHAQQWANIKAQIVEANKPAIVQATLENLPDAVVETEGLERGFIPKRITIPLARR